MSSSRQLAAVMFTDIVGYTALMGIDEKKAFELLRKNREIQKPIIEEFGGRWIKELGDGVLATFPAVSNAVYAAVKIQDECYQFKAFELRIGIHQGEVVFENGDIFGDAVNIASRLQALAPPATIFVSESVQRDLFNKTDIKSKF
ncbi:MAG: adenylate/guanylate cyclase domain-containing protein, partial [Chitinophagaceae bacterium]